MQTPRNRKPRNKFEQELIAAKERAEESELQQKALIDNSVHPITITTFDGKIAYFNKQAFKFF